MKYEVTGDTIVIKYIADGKYKTLELNKNDNIDLDFFGQLIKAKNNKQDAMCDLYAKEVLSYDPSPERITNMNLTKIDEPSEYTKKEAAKLRIEELNRDLKSIRSELRTMILPQYEHKKIEELKPDYLIHKNMLYKFNDLKNKYASINLMIDKEQKIYNENNKNNNLTNDEFLKKITNEFESKLNKVVDNSDERRQIMNDVLTETTPKNEITQELRTIGEILEPFSNELDQRLKVNKDKFLDNKTKRLIDEYKEKQRKEKEIDSDDSIELSDDDDGKKNDIPEMKIQDLDIPEPEITKEEEESVIDDMLNNDNYIKDTKTLLIGHIEYLIRVLEKTDINLNIINDLQTSIVNLTELNAKNLKDTLQLIIKCLNDIDDQNKNNKINFTPKTINKIIKNATNILMQQDRIETLYNKKITNEFIQFFTARLPKNNRNKLQIITNLSNRLDFTQQNIDKIFNNVPGIFIWKQEERPDRIYSNVNLFDICTPDTITFKATLIQCFYVTTTKLKENYFSIFNNYITTEKTDYKLPLETMDLYLDLHKKYDKRELSLNGGKYNITYVCFEFKKSPIANMLKILSGQGEGIKYKMNDDGGKIDLDKADTEDKLSEIVRLLQNISYNLFTLTPNYEESEKNKRLKSKGIDLKQLFD